MTLISHTHRFVFVHMHRTGGSAVVNALAPLITWRDLILGVTPLGEALHGHFQLLYGVGKHSRAVEVRAMMGADYNHYRSFSVIRDPVDRALSMFGLLHQWNAWRKQERWQTYVDEFDAAETFEDFARSEFFHTPGPDRLFMGQSYWLTDDDGHLIVDELLNNRRLADDLAAFVRSLGVETEIVVERLNESRLASQVSDDGRALIRERYAPDYDLLATRHAFDNLSPGP